MWCLIHSTFDDFLELSLGMGTSEQMDIGSEQIKRFGSLFSKG